jgi:hypothetical protein
VSSAFGFFVTATVLPSVVADIGGLAFLPRWSDERERGQVIA